VTLGKSQCFGLPGVGARAFNRGLTQRRVNQSVNPYDSSCWGGFCLRQGTARGGVGDHPQGKSHVKSWGDQGMSLPFGNGRVHLCENDLKGFGFTYH